MKTKPKYGNRKVTVDGIEFDSKKEAQRYAELKRLEHCGSIHSLEMQREFELIPAQYEHSDLKGKARGKCIERAVKYKADFCYFDSKGNYVVEDVKGYRNPASAGYAKFVLKRKLMLYIYGIQIKEI